MPSESYWTAIDVADMAWCRVDRVAPAIICDVEKHIKYRAGTQLEENRVLRVVTMARLHPLHELSGLPFVEAWFKLIEGMCSFCVLMVLRE